MNYADPFAVTSDTPLNRALQKLSLQADTQMHWPSGYLGPNYLGSINQIAPAANGFAILLPAATGANIGTGFLITNTGAFIFTVKNSVGVVLTTLDPGTAKYFYNEENTTAAGVWRSYTMGQGTSSADAVQLAGLGLVATNGKLQVAHPITSSSSNFTVTQDDRASVFVAASGSASVIMPNHSVVGNSFFFGAHNGGSGTMVLTPDAGDTIDGYASISLSPNESVFVFSSGSDKWYTIGYGRSTQFQFTKLVKDVSAGGTFTLTSAEASNKLLQFIGNPASNVIVNVPSVVGIYYVQNTYSGSYALTVKTVGGSGVALTSTDRAILYCDGTNVVAAQSAAIGTNISVVDGTLAAPAVNFVSDNNTGFYLADVATVGFVSDGVESARFSAAKSYVLGKFGVGIVNPASKLHVVGDNESVRLQGNNSHLAFYAADGTTRIGYIQGLSSGEMRDATDNGARTFYIGSNKKVEITAAGMAVTGALSASNLSGTNTGDQNLSGFATIQSLGNYVQNATLANYVTNATLANYPTASGVAATYASLSSNNVLAGVQTIKAIRGVVANYPLPLSGVVPIDMTNSSTHMMVLNGNTTFTFLNTPPAFYDQTVYLKLTNGGNYSVVFTNSKFPNGAAPALTPNGKDLLAIWYDYQTDAYVVSLLFKDYR